MLEILLINQIKVYIELKTNYKILVRFRVASRIDNHSFDPRFSGMYVLREFENALRLPPNDDEKLNTCCVVLRMRESIEWRMKKNQPPPIENEKSQTKRVTTFNININIICKVCVIQTEFSYSSSK